jgi:hypothetical protein
MEDMARAEYPAMLVSYILLASIAVARSGYEGKADALCN